jgi:hypothetical protein
MACLEASGRLPRGHYSGERPDGPRWAMLDSSDFRRSACSKLVVRRIEGRYFPNAEANMRAWVSLEKVASKTSLSTSLPD